MRNHTDTAELRREFAEKFLASPQDHTEAVLDGEMQTLIDDFDAELCTAKSRWISVDVAAEWAEMDRWLSDHGYIEQQLWSA